MEAPTIHVLDLDGGVSCQQGLTERYRPTITSARMWGQRLRLGVGLRRFQRFCRSLSLPGSKRDGGPRIVLPGSGDFHHVTLALLQRMTQPMNLLVLDNHPDWMRGVPFLHCGTWLWHAARLAQVVRVYHVGGNVDFDNFYRWLAPWSLLEGDRIRVLPAVRHFSRGRWRGIPHEPLRDRPSEPADVAHVTERIAPWREELGERPLYVSVDKDVLIAEEAAVNWDSGKLTLNEVTTVIRTCLELAGGRLAGADLLGDWSPVRTKGLLPSLLDRMRRVPIVDPQQALARNETTNLLLLDCILASTRSS